jgi:predicted acetyltransferase
MAFELRLADQSAREHIERMMQPYLLDLGAPPDFVYPRLDVYWREPGRYPYIIVDGEQIIGFMLVHQINEKPSFNLVEFYIAAGFRNRGYGRQAADAAFKLHFGEWSVGVLRNNVGAQAFWQSVLQTNPSVTVVDVKSPDGVMYKFSSRHDDA